jgi:hypothetical protein
MKIAFKGRSNSTAADGLPHSLGEAMALQEIEGNPLSPDEVALVVMFERENWPHEKRLAYISDLARKAVSPTGE